MRRSGRKYECAAKAELLRRENFAFRLYRQEEYAKIKCNQERKMAANRLAEPEKPLFFCPWRRAYEV
jgi:hypothetical protein